MRGKFVSIKSSPFGDNMKSVLVTDNGFQWESVFKGNHTACIRIAKAFMKEGYKEAPGEDIKSWFA
jgi:hypothetical protein